MESARRRRRPPARCRAGQVVGQVQGDADDRRRGQEVAQARDAADGEEARSPGRAAAPRRPAPRRSGPRPGRLAQLVGLRARDRGERELGALPPPAAASTSTRTSPSSRCRNGSVTRIPRTRSSGMVHRAVSTPEWSGRPPAAVAEAPPGEERKRQADEQAATAGPRRASAERARGPGWLCHEGAAATTTTASRCRRPSSRPGATSRSLEPRAAGSLDQTVGDVGGQAGNGGAPAERRPQSTATRPSAREGRTSPTVCTCGCGTTCRATRGPRRAPGR